VQLRQDAALLAPSTADAYPGMQGVHADGEGLPTLSLYVPAGHDVQDDVPANAE
jgi:hypothetical protein